MLIALIAHDQRKTVMADFVSRHQALFARFQLVATGNTGKLIEDRTGLKVQRVAHGPDGGDLIIGGMVAEDRIGAVIFFRDPLTAQPMKTRLLRV